MSLAALDLLRAVIIYALVAIVLSAVGMEIAKNSIELFRRGSGRNHR